MKGVVWRPVIVATLAALVGCACLPSFGDTTRTVTLRNGFAHEISLYTYKHEPQYETRLGPGESLSEGWMFPVSAGDSRVRRVEADDPTGARVFCLDLTYGELVKRNWQVDVKPGASVCRSSREDRQPRLSS